MKIFISYAHASKDKVLELVELLRSGGYDPWFDRELIVGQEWKGQLEQAIQKCEIFVYVLTPETILSEWCQWELGKALELKKPIIPILLKHVSLPKILEVYQFVDFTGGFGAQETARLMVGLASALVVNPLIQNSMPNRVLIVEDSQEFQEEIRDICLEFDVEVDLASTKPEAAEYIRNKIYGLITLDMQLSPTDANGESGKFLLGLWKRKQPNSKLVIISKLPWDKNETRTFFRKYDVLDVLDKPLDQEIFLNILQGLFGNAKDISK